MTKNIGNTDRIIRLTVGALLLALPFFSGISAFSNTPLTIVSYGVGAVLIGTALFKFCPLYRLLGIRTRKAHTGWSRM